MGPESKASPKIPFLCKDVWSPLTQSMGSAHLGLSPLPNLQSPCPDPRPSRWPHPLSSGDGGEKASPGTWPPPHLCPGVSPRRQMGPILKPWNLFLLTDPAHIFGSLASQCHEFYHKNALYQVHSPPEEEPGSLCSFLRLLVISGS